MKKLMLIMLSASVMLASCNKSGKEAASPSQLDDSAPVAVQFTSNIQKSHVTKGEGALDGWNTQTLYVYGLRRDDNGKYVIASDPAKPYDQADDNAYLIRNVDAEAPSAGLSGAINVYRTKPSGEDPGEFFFYRELCYYDFYAYFVDDAASPAPTESEDRIELGVTIDGTQDILLAKTDREADIAGKGVEKDKAYGAYAARREVVPNLVFEHQLARFNFKVKAGNTDTDGAVTIKGVTVGSVTDGTLVIASNDPENYPLGLHPDDAEMVQLQVVTDDDADYLKPRVTVQDFGEPILVMPGKQLYPVRLSFSQSGYTVDGGIRTQDLEIDFTKANYTVPEGQTKDVVATAGHSYDVTIIIYGLEQVEINVTMTEWKPSGEFELDPDV